MNDKYLIERIESKYETTEYYTNVLTQYWIDKIINEHYVLSKWDNEIKRYVIVDLNEELNGR